MAGGLPTAQQARRRILREQKTEQQTGGGWDRQGQESIMPPEQGSMQTTSMATGMCIRVEASVMAAE
ncbi:hypothetical protein KJE20_01356 [Pyrenophora tritici-repentis]|nr:hypothetical protein KJE20_01356 [Pyrenophora tritici-repentis]